ncbi:hypothetical protein DZD44_02015 [Campylobacter hepaticus]|nr:hypothetical protein DZD44_02015 [Campylobacter hepaticus]
MIKSLIFSIFVLIYLSSIKVKLDLIYSFFIIFVFFSKLCVEVKESISCSSSKKDLNLVPLS